MAAKLLGSDTGLEACRIALDGSDLAVNMYLRQAPHRPIGQEPSTTHPVLCSTCLSVKLGIKRCDICEIIEGSSAWQFSIHNFRMHGLTTRLPRVGAWRVDRRCLKIADCAIVPGSPSHLSW